MSTRMGRPVEFDAAKKEKLCVLVGVGVSRANAARGVGVAPSTVTRHMEADPEFAEQVRDAENECEIDLLKRIRLQSERSWRAAVWLLEHMRPERYARGKAAQPGASWDEMFGQMIALIDAEVADESLRERLVSRLDEMALAELAEEAEPEAKLPAVSYRRTAAPGAAAPQTSQHAMPADAKKLPQVKAGKLVPAAALPTGRVEELLGLAGRPGKQHGTADFCNASLDVHERRSLDKLGT